LAHFLLHVVITRLHRRPSFKMPCLVAAASVVPTSASPVPDQTAQNDECWVVRRSHSRKHCTAVLPCLPDSALDCEDSDGDDQPMLSFSRSDKRRACLSRERLSFLSEYDPDLDDGESTASEKESCEASHVVASRSEKCRGCIVGPGRQSLRLAQDDMLDDMDSVSTASSAPSVALQRSSSRHIHMRLDQSEDGLFQLAAARRSQQRRNGVRSLETSCFDL